MRDRPPIQVVRFESIASTSLHARALVDGGAAPRTPTAFIAARQTAGVGRWGRRFTSPPGGLWCTLCWPVGAGPNAGVPGPDTLGVRLGWACLSTLRRCLERHGPGAAWATRLSWKWPNDVLLDGRKVLGVLSELVGAGPARCLLIGVGINANLSVHDLPEELRDRAGTLRDVLASTQPADHTIDLAALENDLLSALAGAIEASTLPAGAIDELRASLAGLGRAVRGRSVAGMSVEGVLAGIDEAGRLLVDDAGGTRHVCASVDD